MKIYTDTPEGTTVIQNTFIDQYMPHANGEFVKVYLYLLRCANSDRELSLSSIADVFDHTEKDVQRALAYWEKQQLLRLQMTAGGDVKSVVFCGSDTSGQQVSASERASSVYQQETEDSREDSGDGSISRDRSSDIRQQKEVKQLFYVAEQYLQRPLTSAEQNDFIYYYDTLKFSTDLIEYLLEYSISKGCASRHYMRKVALAWAEAGISSVLQAKQETNLHNRNFFTVMNAFGIKGRGPAVAEQEYMTRWFDEYCFTTDIVLEACSRTIRQTHQPNFQYADKILDHWHRNGVTSVNDISRLDQQRKNEQKKSDQKQQQNRPQSSAANRFNNFEQRAYDYNQLEKQLLNH